jgi:hypothetical protein
MAFAHKDTDKRGARKSCVTPMGLLKYPPTGINSAQIDVVLLPRRQFAVGTLICSSSSSIVVFKKRLLLLYP